MPPRWPSSARPASHAPRCGTATFRVSCDHALPLVPAITTSAPSAAMNASLVVVVVIVVPPVAARGGRDHLSRYTEALQATIGLRIGASSATFARDTAGSDTHSTR